MTASTPTSLAACAHAADTVTPTLADADGTIYSATIPAGSFVASRSGSRLTFRDPTGTIAGGLTRVTLALIRGGLRFTARGRNLDLPGADRPEITTTIQLGGQPFRSTNLFRMMRTRLRFP